MSSRDFPPEIDYQTPSIARVYAYTLGLTEGHYEADRMAASYVEERYPGTFALARNNRRYLGRVVRTLAEEFGIRQFIDHGTGLPTGDNVHQVAQRVAPESRVVYVENDPIVLRENSVKALEGTNTAFILEDARNTDAIFNHPETRRLIDFDEPVAALFISFFHCIPDRNDPVGLARRTIDRLAPGSCIAISHLVSDDEQVRSEITDFIVSTTGGNWGRVRTKEEVASFFDGLEIIDPGLVEVTAWRPTAAEEQEEQTFRWLEYGGVGRKPS